MLLFAAASAVHIWCGDFPKGIDVLPDERRYLEIARSLFAGDGLIIRGAASDFQKILYPLSLFPALLFEDGQTQIRVVNILNSIYACSIVFPALAIARKLFRRPGAIIGCMVLALLAPDLMYSMTFMTECVFMPLSLWVIYLCWRCFEANGWREAVMAVATGLLSYLTYLCKEVAWMYLIAFMAIYLVMAVRKQRSVQRALGMIALFGVGFFAPFIIMKLTLFAGLLNSYGQFSFDILLAPYAVLFSLYSIAVDGVYFVVGFGVFPVLYVACTYRELPREERDLALFCLISLLAGLACVVFTISMREDVGHVALRQHLRYVAPLALPLLMLFVKQAARLDPARITSQPKQLAWLVGTTAAFCVFVVAFFGSANLAQGFDNSQFHFMRWLLDQADALSAEHFDSWAQTFSAIATDDGDLLVIEPLNWLSRACVIAFTVFGMWALMSQNTAQRNMGAFVITGIIAIFMVANSVCAYHYNRSAYAVDEQDVTEICAISNKLAKREQAGQVVIVLDKKNTGPNNLIDTYLQDAAGEYEYVLIENAREYLYPASAEGAPNEAVAYVLVNSQQHITGLAEGAKCVGGDGAAGQGNWAFSLYEFDNPTATDR